MKKVYMSLWVVIVLVSSVFGGENPKVVNTDTLYQVSTIDALLSGYYDGDKKVSDLKMHGDFGLGTFNGIDGEMVVEDGIVYQVKGTGKVRVAEDTLGVPFASIHFFKPESERKIHDISSYENLKKALDTESLCQNYPCAFKIDGLFDFVKTRSEPKASKPYPALAQYIREKQNFFEAKHIQGTLIGYYMPTYFSKVNVTGYHFHFISEDKQFGGHVLDLVLKRGTMKLDMLYDVNLALLKTHAFEMGTIKSTKQDLDEVEKDPAIKK